MSPRAVNIAQLIALTLATANTTGCWFFGCGDTTTETPMSVSDWSVTMARYDAIKAASDGSGDTGTGGSYGATPTPWDELDAEGQCAFACAYALDEIETHLGNRQPYRSITIDSCELSIPTADGDGVLSCTATVTDTDICIGGRRPLAWTSGQGPCVSTQDQLDGMVVMERVSITAFEELAAQLEVRGAPAQLIARCRAAGEDEARHVELLVAIGARRPNDAPEPAASTTALLDIAMHNATEGCVAETWAALLAHHQADHAHDAATRRAFAEIAEDETRHAQLAWDLHTWLCSQLDAEQLRAVEAARREALERLEATVLGQALAVPAEVRGALGLPAPREAASLARDFGRRLAAA